MDKGLESSLLILLFPAPDVTLSPWSGDSKCHQRRVLTYTIPISNPLGPKSASVVETQVSQTGGQLGWVAGGAALTPSLVPADPVPARPAGRRVCGRLGGAYAGHPLPGLLLHCPPLLHPGPCPEQGPSPVSSCLTPHSPSQSQQQNVGCCPKRPGTSGASRRMAWPLTRMGKRGEVGARWDVLS